MKQNILLIAILTLIFSLNSYSQCDCAAQGTGLNLLQMPENLEKKDKIGRFKLSALYKTLYGDKNFTNNSEAPKGMIEYFKLNYSSLYLNYYFNNDFTFFSDLGYFINKEQKFRLGGSINGNGLSHFSIGSRYSIFENPNIGNELLFSLSASIPLSSTDSTLPYHIQSSSGAVGIHSNLTYYQSLADRRLNLMLSLAYDYNFENSNKYQYGDVKSLDLMGVYSISQNFSLSLGNKLEFRSDDNKYNQEVLTGGSFATIYPGIHYRIWDLLFSGIYEYPYYINTNGTQMVTNYSLIFNVGWWFSI